MMSNSPPTSQPESISRATQSLDRLKRTSQLKEPWRNSRFEWVSELSGSEIGDIGEKLVCDVVGGTQLPRAEQKKAGYDVISTDSKLIEVKTCRISFSQTNVWSWKQVRKQDKYTHLCLVAIEPDRARVFMIPRPDIKDEFLSNQHTTGGDKSISQIAINSKNLPRWITDYEIL